MLADPEQPEPLQIGDLLNGTAAPKTQEDALSSPKSARRPVAPAPVVPQVMPTRPANAAPTVPGLPPRPPGAPEVAKAAVAAEEAKPAKRPDVKQTFDIKADNNDMLVQLAYWSRKPKGHLVNAALASYLKDFPKAFKPITDDDEE